VIELTSLVVTVDDDASMRKALSRLIQSARLKVASFGSAEEFLDSGRWQECGCLILDVRMPGMGGLELQSQLAELGCRIPIIFITAHPDEQERLQAMKGGAVGYFRKPFDDQELLKAISSTLKYT
jgi:FixJ family two-component response regulator